MAATEAQFSYPSACKSSWGAALLYQITGERQYLDWLGRFARWYLDAQEPEGFWHPWVEETSGDVIDITLEYVCTSDPDRRRQLPAPIARREPRAAPLTGHRHADAHGGLVSAVRRELPDDVVGRDCDGTSALGTAGREDNGRRPP